MQVVILAGGFGTRISEESHLKPKPMIEVGQRPILWHIMKLYSHYGYNDFIICAGYKQHVIKEYFANYCLHSSQVTFDLQSGSMEIHSNSSEPWRVTVIDTGLATMTGGRVKRIQKYIGDEPFLLTYGDGVSDVHIAKLIDFHNASGAVCTITATSVAQRFGVLELAGDKVIGFREKSVDDNSLINAGFMVCDPALFDYIEGDAIPLEQQPMSRLSAEGKLAAYVHTGYWQCMDTQREKEKLEALWETGAAPWKVWAD